MTGRFDAGHLEEKRGELTSIVDELGESVEAFCRFTGIGGHHDEHIEALSAEFFRQMSKGADNLSLWLDGYSVDVELRLHRVLVNGYVERGHEPSPEQILTLPEGAVLTFRPVAGSHLPHYPASNPHVLEQPPTL